MFEISPDRLDEIRVEVDRVGKNTYWFEAELTDESGVAVARVKKEVYVRAKTTDAKPANGG